MTTPIVRLILGDQLNENHTWFSSPRNDVTYALMEILPETTYVTHHIQKLCAFFAAMRAFADGLRSRGHRVVYIPLDDPENHQSFKGNVEKLIADSCFKRFEYLLPDEMRLDRELARMAKTLPIPSQVHDTEHFLTNRDSVARFFEGKKLFLMESFYRSVRKEFGFLMEGNKPLGGKWNYDILNRARYDEAVPIPEPVVFENDVTGIVKMIDAKKVSHFGEIVPERLIWPISREQALAVLDTFLREGLPHFGTYEDAMTVRSWSLFHSRLSFALNTKMLSPQEIINAAIEAWEERKDDIEIQQIEGFVRQICGWREYMRGMYWKLMPEFAAMNFFDQSAPLPHYYWDGETKMACLRHVLSQSLTQAYAHHIQRLMVAGNFALLSGIDPDEVDRWYLGVYIDAVEWVEKPNTRGMSQFADGGIIATKPYVSSARYIHSMSDYCDACHYDWQRRHGENACPFNSLYWEFLERHRGLLASNPRMGLVYHSLDRMDKQEVAAIMRQAEYFRSHLETL